MQQRPEQRPRSGRFSRRPRIAVAIALAAVLLVAVGLLLPSHRRSVHSYNSGPLQSGSDTSTSIAVELGQPFTFGGIVVYNKTSRPVVIDDIRMVPPASSGMEILAIEVAGGDRRIGYVGADQGYPPPDLRPYLRPYHNAAVAPERTPEGKEGTEIVFGLRLNRPGNFGFEHVEVEYRVGKTWHRVRLEDGFLACAPRSSYPQGCDHEAFFGANS